MHKYVKDLAVGDVFAMAGAHYRITRFYETVDPETIKFKFMSVAESANREHTLCLHEKALFHLV